MNNLPNFTQEDIDYLKDILDERELIIQKEKFKRENIPPQHWRD